VGTRTPVFIYAADPLSAAGAKAQLMNEPMIELVGPVDLDRARVALVVAEAADESAARVARAIQRDGVPNVVVVAARFDEAGVVQSVAAGVTSFLRRSEATSVRLAEVIRDADRSGCQLPAGLRKRAATIEVHSMT
jgi:DNA-binding NarL/FixJ family response regulator